jgi:hypothetical protein
MLRGTRRIRVLGLQRDFKAQVEQSALLAR